MKKIYLIVLVMVMIGTICLSSCSTNNQSSGTGVSTSSADDVKMEALVREKLQDHHSIDRIFNAHHTREEWNTTLDRMISYGAKISADEKTQLIDWLIARNK